MQRLTDIFQALLCSQKGATAIEYALIAGIISLALLGVLATGNSVDNLYNATLALLSAAISG